MAARSQRPAPSTSPAPDVRAVLEASPNAIVAVDARGDVRYANAHVEATFGWPASELMGRPVEMLVPVEPRARHAVHRARFAEQPSARPMGIGLDLAGRRRDGTTFPVEISLAPVDTPAGRLVYATVVDITARKTLEDQLLQAQKMESIGRLAGGIAHDFNNMLFAIRGYADMLLEDLAAAGDTISTSALRPGVEAIGGAAERASALTAQLLLFSRRHVVHPVVVDVHDAIVSIEPMLRCVIGEQLRLVLALDPATGEVRADPSQLDQILLNLVVNARDAMPDGGTVTIETGNVVFDEAYAEEHFDLAPGAYVMLAVSDTGYGMDRETRLHVFEPFFPTKGPGRGRASACQRSTASCARRAATSGSTPSRGPAPRSSPTSRGPMRRSKNSPRYRDAAVPTAGTVLLVEDDPTVLELTRRMLERGGYVVLAAANAREALGLLEAGGHLDALVTDVAMPDVSATELARRTLALRTDLPILLLSRYAAETADVEALLREGVRFAGKPIASRDLLRLLGDALGQRSAQTYRRSEETPKWPGHRHSSRRS